MEWIDVAKIVLSDAWKRSTDTIHGLSRIDPRAVASATGYDVRRVARRINPNSVYAGEMYDYRERWPNGEARAVAEKLAAKAPIHPIVALYWSHLGRAPDQPGFDFWEGVLLEGKMTWPELVNAFLKSK